MIDKSETTLPPEAAVDAAVWVESDCRAWPLSFTNVCDALAPQPPLARLARAVHPPGPVDVPRVRESAPNVSIDQGGGPMPRDTTMLELVSALSAHARSEDEVVAWVVALVNSGAVRLCGIFKGTRFEASIGEPSWQAVSAAASPEGGAR